MELKAVLLIAVTMLGMCYALLGSLKLALAERLEITEDKVGGLVAAFGFMVGPVILASGFLTDSLGRKGVWLGGRFWWARACFCLRVSGAIAARWWRC